MDSTGIIENNFDLIICPFFVNPSMEKPQKRISGDSIADLIEEFGLGIFDLIISINGKSVQPEHWKMVFPRSGSRVLIRLLPQGGGKKKKSTLSLIAGIAGVILTGNLGPSFAKRFGVTQAMGTAIAGFAVQLTLNALIPPPKQNLSQGAISVADSPIFSITGSGNQLNAYGAIPKIYGRMRVYPPLAAKPYTETIDNEQYLIQVFAIGYDTTDNDLILSDIQIGDTDITDYTDYELIYGTSLQYLDDDKKSIFGADVTETSLAILLEQTAGFSTQTTVTNTTGISFDVSALGGLTVFADDGSRSARSVEIQAELKLSSSSTWLPFFWESEQGSWASKLSLPAARYFAGSASYGGKIYIAGGFDGSSYLNTLIEYDPATNTYTNRASLSTARAKFSLVVVGATLWAIGGETTAGTKLSSVEIYTIASNTWSAGSSLNTARSNLAAVVAGSDIYVIGGISTGGSDLHSVEYSNGGAWSSSLAPAPGFGALATSSHLAVLQSNTSSRVTILICGGSAAPAQIYSLQIAYGTYSASPIGTLATSMSAPIGELVGSDIIMIQGTAAQKVGNLGGWSQALEALPEAHTSGCTGQKDGILYVFGGSANQVVKASGHEKILLSGNTTNVYRKTFKRTGLAAGQYDVRVKRVTADSSDDKDRNEITWTAIRSFQATDSVVFPNVKTLCLRIKATNQLNGIIDRLNCLVESVLPVWSGSAFANAKTRNPAWAFCDVLRGAANRTPIPDSRINLAAILTWANNCDTAGRKYDKVIDSFTTIYEILADIASAGRASMAIVDGKYTIVEDVAQTVPIQHFTPRNILANSFRGSKNFLELPHAIKARFVNEEVNYQQDERIVYDDGYDSSNATIFAEVDYPGITIPDQIWKRARYDLAVGRLRPETFEIQCDVENLACTRGDLVRLTHDVPLLGLGSGRVSALTVNGSNHVTQVVIDSLITVNSGTNYTIRIRAATGLSYTQIVQSDSSGSGIEEDIFNVVTPGAGMTGANVAVADLIAIGTTGSESFECLVKAIEYGSDLTAKLTLVPYNSAIYTADSGSIPAYDSKITLPIRVEQQRPPEPVLENVRSDEWCMYRSIDGSFKPAILLTFKPIAVSRQDPPDIIEAIYRRTPGGQSFETARSPAQSLQIRLDNVEQGAPYSAFFRYITRYGVASDWAGDSAISVATPHTVIGKNSPPTDVAGLSASAQKFRVTLSWTENADPDIFAYEIRLGATWGSATLQGTTLTNSFSTDVLDSGTKTFLVKAIDTSGNYSTNATSVSVAVSSGSAPVVLAQGYKSTALLSWTPTDGTFKNYNFKIFRGSVFATASYVKTVDVTATEIIENSSGTYTYWVQPVDLYGNLGTQASASVELGPPSDYIFYNELAIDFDSGTTGAQTQVTKTNIVTAQGFVFPAIDPTDTWESHFTESGFASPQAQVDAGYTYYMEPVGAGVASSVIEYYIDMIGASGLITGANVTITIARTIIDQDIPYTLTVQTSSDSSFTSPQTFTDLTQFFSTNFRYVKVKLDFTISAPMGNKLCDFQSATVRIDSDPIADSGYITSADADWSAGVITVNFGKSFLDVQSIQCTPVGSGSENVIVVVDSAVYSATSPTSFVVRGFKRSDGTAVACSFSWSAIGV